MQRVFTLFEGSKLKGQQADKMKGAEILKAVEGKFSAKLQHFKNVPGIEHERKHVMSIWLYAYLMYVCVYGWRTNGWMASIFIMGSHTANHNG